MFYSTQKAFVLLMTLWMLAIIAMGVGFFALWTERTLAIALSMQEDFQGEIDMRGTEATVLYLLATQPFTIAGMTMPELKSSDSDKAKSLDELMDEMIEQSRNKKNMIVDDEPTYSILPVGRELRLDDRPYYGQGKAFFALQDEGGLFSLNLATESTINRFLGLLGVSSEVVPSLVAKLQDYMDIDDLHRLNGAEKNHYKNLNLPLPTNHFLLHPMQTKRVMDWANEKEIWADQKLLQLMNKNLSSLPNFNTAPALVLQAAYGITASAAEQLVQLRESSPFYKLSTIQQITGDFEIDQLYLNVFPIRHLRLTLWHSESRRMRQIHLELTHDHDEFKPWRVLYTTETALLPNYQTTTPSYAKTSLFNPTVPTTTH